MKSIISTVASLLVSGLVASAAAAANGSAPVPAPAVFVGGDYAITFRTPPHTTICKLPADWVGSNHGTVVFLVPPRSCGAVGYPSSSRDFTGDVPRIEVFYAYWDPDVVPSLIACGRKYGRANLFGKNHPICLRENRRHVRLSISGRYISDTAAWMDIDLLTTPRRLPGDLKIFRTFLRSVEPCKVSDGKGGFYGENQPCPVDGVFF